MFLDTIIKKSTDNVLYPALFTILLAAAGITAFSTLPIDAIPDITNVQVTVNTAAAGQTPDVIESNITYPIESAMNSIPGMEEVRSVTRYGISQVTVVFEDGTDIYMAHQLVSEQLQSVDLPETVSPELGPISTGLGEIVYYTLRVRESPDSERKKLDLLQELDTLHRWEIIPRLMSVKGVNEVNTIGGYPRQYHVTPDPSLTSHYGIHFDDILRAVEDNSYNSAGGYIQQSAEQLLVQGRGIYTSPEDIRQIPVKMLQNFRTITVGDIATVDYGKELRTGAAVHNAEESIIGTVMMLQGENSRTVSDNVTKEINEIKKNLPAGTEIDVLYSRSDLVNSTLETVKKNILMGAGLVIVFLFLLVGNFRAALITAFVVPLSLLGTFILMKLFNIPGSLMSLGAIDFGIVIDGAVIVMDSCARSISERARAKGRSLSRAEIRETVGESAVNIRGAAGLGQLIIIIVFIPLFMLTGIEGKMFSPMATGFCFALASSFVLSFTVVPALAGRFLSGKPDLREPFLMRTFRRLYMPALEFCLKHRFKVVLTAILTIAASALIFSRMGAEFIPNLSEGTLAAKMIRPVNISPDMSVEMQKISDRAIMEFDEVRDVFSRLGASEISTDPVGVDHVDCIITLKPVEKWPLINGKRRTFEELKNAISEKLRKAVPGQEAMMSQPVQMRFNHLIEGFDSDITLLVYGSDLEELEHIAEDAAELLRSLPGAASVQTSINGKTPLLKITPRMDVINRLGIEKRNVLETVRIALGGAEAGHIYHQDRKFPIEIRLPDRYRNNIAAIGTIPVGVSENFTVPLSDVAKLTIDDIYIQVNREQSRRRAGVLINMSGERDTQSFVEEAKKLLNEKLHLPDGYFTRWKGFFQNYSKAGKRLAVAAPVAMILIFMLIYSVFKNTQQSLIIFLGVPFAIAGGVINLAIMGLPFSISAGIGFIAVSGIAVLNGIVLISCYNSLRRDGLHGPALIREGASMRIRAVLMTALTDIFGFLPMMLATGIGSEVQKPLAVVVVGGITTSTLLTLFIMPILYEFWEKREREC